MGATTYCVRLEWQSAFTILPRLVEKGMELLNISRGGSLGWSVRPMQSEMWSHASDTIVLQEVSAEPQFVQAESNGLADLMFARVQETWNGNYQARHVGCADWTGTDEVFALEGMNRITDVFAGSDDSSILLLTDDGYGDALFIDDIYSALPAELSEQQARVFRLNCVYAGGGDDLVDMTSQRFVNAEGGMEIHGGEGNDVIWAGNGENWLFGDAGDDRIVGASGNDVIAGGSGNDFLHGGGGEDLFVFGDNWGKDTVKQMPDGKVTLWFRDGDESKWNAALLTYTDGENTVKVTGVTEVSLKFGDDHGNPLYKEILTAGAFDDFTSERVFENKGMLA